MDRIEEIREMEQAAKAAAAHISSNGDGTYNDGIILTDEMRSKSIAFLLSEIDRMTAELQEWKDKYSLEIQEVNARADMVCWVNDELTAEIEALKAENARLSRERDAAVADMWLMRAKCHICGKYKKSCKPKADELDGCSAFEWRGIEPAESEESVTQSMPEDMRDRFRESYGGAKTFAELDYKSKLGVWDTN